MPTKEYTDSLSNFCGYYNIDYDPNDLKTNKKILKTLGKNNLAPISNNPAANSYFDALSTALTLYVQKRMEVGNLHAYDIFSGDNHKSIYLSDFIIAFELMMQDKFKSDFSDGKELRDRKPFEGMAFENVARSALGRIRERFGKSLSSVWADNIIDNVNVMYDLINISNTSMEELKNANVKNLDSTDCDNIKNIVTAKKAMENVRAKRGFFWPILPWNWSRNSEEKAFLNKLTDTLNLYKRNGLSDNLLAEIMGNDNRMILSGVQEETEDDITAYNNLGENDKPWIIESYANNSQPANDEIDIQAFFKPGYIPNINNLKKEEEIAKNAEKSLNNAIIEASNPNSNKKEADKASYWLAREVFKNNYKRLQEVTAIKEEQRAEHMNFYNEIYKAQDEGWMEKHPDYVAPEIPENLEEPKIQVDLSSVFVHKENVKSSEKVQEAPPVSNELKNNNF
jgi:hypothetical protein